MSKHSEEGESCKLLMSSEEIEVKRKKACEYSRNWKLRHPEKLKQSNASSYKKNGKKNYAKWRKKKLIEDPEYFNKRIAAWKLKNKKRSNQIYAKWKRKRYRTDPNFKLKQILMTSLSKALKRDKATKILRIEQLLGINISSFKEYIEKKFQEGMSWENHSKFGWHIDHIIPCVNFNLTIRSEQLKCFHYTNLQPLWWQDNLSKSDKICILQ